MLINALLVGIGGFLRAIARIAIGVERIAKLLRLSEDLPIVVEIVDTPEKIEAFLPEIDEAIPESLATLERVQIRFYRSGEVAKA